MYMARVTCVNWGNLPNSDYALGPVTLLTGGSGTGKTTMADAIQSVMTGVKRNLYTYNPGQDEATQHGRHGKTPRSLASYILGCDDNAYARPKGAYGYVALVFAPSPGEPEGKVFTAILGVKAFLETVERAGGRRLRTSREEQTRLVVVEGHGIGLSDLIAAREAGMIRPVPTDAVVTALRQRYGDACVNDFSDNKSAYLCKLYGLLRGRPSVSTDEAEKAARTFSRFMAYKPIESIDNFVRTQILEARDMAAEIDNIAGMMRKVQELRTDSERLTRNIALLEDAERDGDTVRVAWRDACEADVKRWYKASHDAQVEIDRCDAKIKELNLEQTRLRNRVKEIDDRLGSLGVQKADILVRLRQHKNVIQRDSLETQRKTQQEIAGTALGELLAALDIARKNLEAAEQLKALPARVRQNERLSTSLAQLDNASADLQLHDLRRIGELALAAAKTDGDPPPARLRQLSDSIAGLEDAHGLFALAVSAPDDGLRDRTQQLYGSLQDQLEAAKKEEKELHEKIENLGRRGAVQYPRDVDIALQGIRQSLPGADPVVLCDLVEMREPDWQSAVEGYLAQNRFLIVVKPEFEARAIRLVRSLRRSAAKVVQGDKALRDAERRENEVPANSIFRTMETRHPIVRAYLLSAYGSVVKVRDSEQLRQTARGLTCDGQGSANYTMFACHVDDEELVFGQSGRERQLRALRGKLDAARLTRQDLERRLADISQVRRLCAAVGTVSAEKHAFALLQAAQAIASLREQIQRIDLSDVAELEKSRTKIEGEIEMLSEEKDKITPRAGKDGAIDKEREHLEGTIKARERDRDDAERKATDATQSLIQYAETEPGYEATTANARLREEAALPSLTLTDAGAAIDAATHRAQTAMGKFLRYLREYNAIARADEQVAYQPQLEEQQFRGWQEFYPFMEAFAQIKTQLRRQRDNRLSEVADQLRRAERDMRNAFTAQFCQLVYDAVRGGESYLNALNNDLKRHQFSEETYEFDREWVEEYKRYYNFFEAVMTIERIGEGEDLFGSTKLTQDQAAVRDELVNLLLDNDQEKAHIKLLEIADYRNYKRYDILRLTHGRDRKDATRLSEWGQGSGGQLETPSYVIRAAAVASAFRLNEGNYHLRAVLIDESFAKMDEMRAKEVIGMLSRTMGFQVIFIMPSKASGPFMPLVTHKMVFSKVRSTSAPGELKTVTYVDQQVLNEEAVARLWDAHRQRVRTQAVKSFEEKRNRERGLA